MDRRGNGDASNDDGSESSRETPMGDAQLSGTPETTEARAAEIVELSRRALSAKADLLTYVGELEEEVRRLRRRLGDAVP